MGAHHYTQGGSDNFEYLELPVLSQILLTSAWRHKPETSEHRGHRRSVTNCLAALIPTSSFPKL